MQRAKIEDKRISLTISCAFVLAGALGQFLGSLENAKIEARTLHKSITRERSSRICDRSRLARQNWPVFASSWNRAAFIVTGVRPPPTRISMCLHNLFRWRMSTRYAATGINGFCLPRTNWRNYRCSRMNCTRGRDFQATELLSHSASVPQPLASTNCAQFVRCNQIFLAVVYFASYCRIGRSKSFLEAYNLCCLSEMRDNLIIWWSLERRCLCIYGKFSSLTG